MAIGVFGNGTSGNVQQPFTAESTDPLSIFRVLAAARVPFLIIGGHAVAFHGYVRTTEDADVIYLRTAAVEDALLGALQSMHACWISNERDGATGLERVVPVSAAYVRATRVMMLTTDFGFLDLFDHVPGMPEQSVRELIEDGVEFDGLRFVSRHWLRRLKRQAGRHKDLDDLEHLGAEGG